MSFFAKNPEVLVPFRIGRRDALERVYRAHASALEKYVRSLNRDAGAQQLLQSVIIADVLQDVFIRAFSPNSREAYDGVRDYRYYLNAIARNCFSDALKARGREVLKAPEEFWFHYDDKLPEPEWVREPRIRAVLTTYLSDLSPVLEEVYVQRFVLNRSQNEASSVLGLSRRQLRTAEAHLCGGLRRALRLAGLLHAEVTSLPQATRASGSLTRAKGAAR